MGTVSSRHHLMKVFSVVIQILIPYFHRKIVLMVAGFHLLGLLIYYDCKGRLLMFPRLFSGILLNFLGQFPLFVLDVHTRVQGGLYLDFLKCDLHGKYWNHFHFHFLLIYLINLNCMM